MEKEILFCGGDGVDADLKIELVNNCILSLTYQALIIICKRSAIAFSVNCRPEFESTARITLYRVY